MLARGREIVDDQIADLSCSADSYRKECERWFNRVDKYLETAFSDLTVSEEFSAGSWGSMGYPNMRPAEQIEDTRSVYGDRIHSLEMIIDVLDLYEEVSTLVSTPPQSCSNHAVFIVHGHDESAKEKAARLVEQIGLTPIILHEHPGKSRTIVEKFEQHASEAGFAIVIASPDDVGAPKATEPRLVSRARQNVWLELGYFVGKLGRARVALLKVGDVEIPTDLLGVEYKPFDSGGKWRFDIVGELQAAGFAVSKDKVVG
jgi:hypothetical protein